MRTCTGSATSAALKASSLRLPSSSSKAYGTLIDWEAGIVEAFRKASAADGIALDPTAVLRTLFDTRPAAERPYRRYREILTAAAQRRRRHKGCVCGRW